MNARFFIALFLFFAGCTVQFQIPPQPVVSNLPDGGKVDVLPDSIPAMYSSRPRFYWEQIERSDSTQSFAVTNGAKDGRWLRGDSMRWIPAGPFITLMTDTLATRAYARSTNANETITLSGDVTGTGTTAITTIIAAGAVGPDELASTAVTPGSYTHASITVDADGRVTAASSGTDNTGMVTFDVIGDAGTAETISNTDELYLRGQFGVNTSNSATDIINFEVDSSEIATQYDLTQIAGLDTLTNYTALRAYTGAGNAVYVQNQGLFFRSASGSENGGTTIVATNSVVWKRFFDGCTYYPEFWEDGGYDETGSAAGITDTTEMIQAAINLANTNGGGEVILKPGRTYNVIPKVVNPKITGNDGCVQIKSNVKFTIPRGAILRKANGAQTDAGGAVEVIIGLCVENVEISGGGKILGNTAGQTGWTGGYAQIINGCGIYISNNTGSAVCNYGITIKDLEVSDHFSNPIDINYFDGVTLKNIKAIDNGEGPEAVAGTNLYVADMEVADTSNVAVGDGVEIANVEGFSVSGIYVHTNGEGVALELYSSDNGTVSNFTLDGYGGGGISLGTNPSTSNISTNITISNGVIRNYPAGGSSGVFPADGRYLISGVVFDSVAIGVNIVPPTLTAGYENEITITGCKFVNFASATGVYSEGAKRVVVSDNDFRKINIGVQNSYDSTGNAYLKILGNRFDSTYTHNIHFDPQGQSYPTFAPTAYIQNNNFTNQLGSYGISGISTNNNIFSQGNYSDYWPPVNGATVEVNGLEEITEGSNSTLTSIINGAKNQIVRINVAGLASFNALNVNDPRNSGGGNLYLKDGEQANMAMGDVITLKYDAANSRWHEISRAQTGNFFGSGKPVGLDRLIIEGWDASDLQDSISNQTVGRFGSTEVLGNLLITRRDMAIRRVCIYSNTAITTGSITGEVWWNGAGPQATVILNSSNQQNNTTTYGKFSKIVPAGSTIEMRYSTSNDFGHAGADIKMWLEVEY